MNARTDPHPHALVSAFMDGELTPEESALVEAHLSGCASCRGMLQDFRLIASSAGAEPIPPPSADLGRRIRDRVGAAAGFHRRRFRFDLRSYRLGLAAAAAAVLVIGLWLSRQGPVPVPGAPPAIEPQASSGNRPGVKGEADDGDTRLKEGSGTPFSPSPPGEVALRDDGRAVQAQREGPMKKSVPAPHVAQAEPKPMAGASGAPAPAAQVGVPAGALSQVDPSAAPPAAHDTIATLRERTDRRTLRFDFPGYTVTLSDDGTLSLSSGGYDCTVRPESPDGDGAVAALFSLSSGAHRGVSAPASPGTTHDGRVSEAVVPRDESASSKDAARPGGAASIDAATAAEMEKRLRVLLRNRYFSSLADRCGPVPKAVQ